MAAATVKHEDKKALCCLSGVTFVDGQAVRSGSSVSWEVRRLLQVSGIWCLRRAGGWPAGDFTMDMAESWTAME